MSADSGGDAPRGCVPTRADSVVKRALGALLTWAALGACLGGVSRADSLNGQLVVEIVGLHSGKGRVAAAVYCSKAGFPGDIDKACARLVTPAKSGKLKLVFDAVPAGEVAVSMFHDENANAKLDSNFLGIPKEGWGTSRDAKARFGPPSYDDAKLELGPGERKRIVVHVQY